MPASSSAISSTSPCFTGITRRLSDPPIWLAACRAWVRVCASIRSRTASACVRSSRPARNARCVNSPGSANRAPSAIARFSSSSSTTGEPCAAISTTSSPYRNAALRTRSPPPHRSVLRHRFLAGLRPAMLQTLQHICQARPPVLQRLPQSRPAARQSQPRPVRSAAQSQSHPAPAASRSPQWYLCLRLALSPRLFAGFPSAGFYCRELASVRISPSPAYRFAAHEFGSAIFRAGNPV